MILKERVVKGSSRYIVTAIPLLFCSVAIRLFEAIMLTSMNYNLPGVNFLRCMVDGFVFDILYFVKASLAFLPLFLIANTVSEKNAKKMLCGVFFLLLMVSSGLVLYFVTAGLPLDTSVFSYSFDELVHTVAASKPIAWWCYLLFLFPFGYLIMARWNFSVPKWSVWTFLVIVIASAFYKGIPKTFYQTRKEYDTAINKCGYLYERVINRAKNVSFSKAETDEMIARFHSYFPEYEFVDSQYPFLHKEITKDVFSPYIRKSDTLPNIVVVIVEGLGRTFTGDCSKYVSATPFLDSLANTGLVWTNCFSTSQRTLCALPSILGALPYGRNGFMNYYDRLLKYQSLPKVLHENGYSTGFYYGGWLGFDNMKRFCMDNSFDVLLDVDVEKTSPEKRNSWGLYDQVLFDTACSLVAFEGDRPHLDVYLTLTTHDPFEYPNHDYYVELYGQGDSRSSQNRASFCYLDDCMRKLLDLYQQHNGYANTLFVITGDHNYDMTESNVEIYHVPLIVWSPLIQQPRKFESPVSHRDITPSLLAFLREQYGVRTPENVAWMSVGLDTSSVFHGGLFLPQFDMGREISQMYYRDKFLMGDDVYQIQKGEGTISIEAGNDRSLKTLLDLYKFFDMYSIDNDMIIK